jgi:hypothetical protein
VDQPVASQESAASVIAEGEFPALYRAADWNSLAGQRRYLTATGLRLAMLVAAAIFGLFSWRTGGGDVAGIAAAGAFGVALLSELYLLQERPDRVWYDGRAAAESAKTLTWRYMVGGNPFARRTPPTRTPNNCCSTGSARSPGTLRAFILLRCPAVPTNSAMRCARSAISHWTRGASSTVADGSRISVTGTPIRPAGTRNAQRAGLWRSPLSKRWGWPVPF